METTTNSKNNISMNKDIINLEIDTIGQLIVTHEYIINTISSFIFNKQPNPDELVYLCKILDRNICVVNQVNEYLGELISCLDKLDKKEEKEGDLLNV